jgi:hypothetical protein
MFKIAYLDFIMFFKIGIDLGLNSNFNRDF